MFYREDFVKWYRSGLFLAAILYLQVDKSCSAVSIKSQPAEPKVGQTVTLLIVYDGKIQMVNWYKGDNIIVTYNPDMPSDLTTGNQFNNRMKVLANGSLQISDVVASDSGNYTLKVTIPYSFAESRLLLTVNPMASTTSFPPHPHPTDGQSKGGNNSVLIGIIIGSAAAVILVAVASFLWYRRGCNKSKPTSTFNNDKQSEDISSKPPNNFNRRLPSIPRGSTVYQNENNIIKENAEHPYTDLAYIYLSGSYLDLQSKSN